MDNDITMESRGLRPLHYNLLIAVALLFVFCTNFSTGDKNKYYSIKSLCSSNIPMLYPRIDGAVIEGKNYTNLDCILTFQTQSILQNFVVRFDFLHLGCEDHLYIYDGPHPFGTYLADLTCTKSNKTIKIIYTRTNFVTFKYRTNFWVDNSNGFKIVVTAVKNRRFDCKEFRCNHPDVCISKDLVSDGINHCEDGSDETEQILAKGSRKTTKRVTVISVLMLLLQFFI
ncbi:uncharacterized protein LOC135141077 isoform X1 [Zophobas morio]|uniref:uncharacterized protein LOC135141077 isoform X1 n=1 Tax=Zophobas morio TaxID=2755281 RepID=UPI00308335E4